MAEKSGKEAPLFRYTAYTPFVGVVLGPALFLLSLVWILIPGGVSSHPSELPTAVVILVFDLALTSISYWSLSRRVWSMRFYRDSFFVRTRRLRKEFAYSEVKDVQRFKVFSGLRGRDILSIEVEGGESFTISGNPTNEAVKADLYDWIRSKSPAKELVVS